VRYNSTHSKMKFIIHGVAYNSFKNEIYNTWRVLYRLHGLPRGKEQRWKFKFQIP